MTWRNRITRRRAPLTESQGALIRQAFLAHRGYWKAAEAGDYQGMVRMATLLREAREVFDKAGIKIEIEMNFLKSHEGDS